MVTGFPDIHDFMGTGYVGNHIGADRHVHVGATAEGVTICLV